ncbi:MAG: hypothetical protein HN778_09045 [Prolixibacteraceae bacterium]|jgi:hypothetical protein|nr:hypothetical protein [Prolixibacteraceae bacterium]MBT6007577.1 hypothetical protein [Prolixibacteraceae bacterium]MBT6764608.1 hypothetical protein [Prolixibacteraceae bacterium]MBT6999263.1 hypothetical protein [Prolixibacteraceae bacterium]MBT7394963.1 hypothetical protein [Prolixibacteraceae bacterium]
MIREKRNKYDKTEVGFIAGAFLPILIFLGIYFFGENEIPFSKYLSNLWHLHALVKLGSLCVFANLLIFMGFIRKKYEHAARGVLGATILYALAVLISRAF